MEISQEILDKTHKGNSKSNIWLVIFFTVLTLISYFIFPPLIVLGIVFSVVILFCVWGKQKIPWYMLCFSSWLVIPTFSFLIGFFSFFTGNAAYKSVGLVREGYDNLDPEKRIWHNNSGCMRSGFEVLTHVPNNLIVNLMYHLFGTQVGVYKGFYPDKNETKKILDNSGQEINFSKENLDFRFTLNNKEYLLKNKSNRFKQYLLECDTAKAAIIKDELIIFKPLVQDKYDLTVTYLADCKTGLVFARYYEK